MSLFNHCISKLLKPNLGPLCIAALSESVSPRKYMFGNQRTICHVMTTLDSTSMRPLKMSDSGRGRDGGKEKKSNHHFAVMFVPAVFKGFFTSDAQKESSPENDLVNHIKRSILLMQNGEPEKAERLLHIALKMAQDMKHEKGVTYIYDTMANLSFENGEYAKAQRLFVEVLRRLIGNGLPHDDMIVLNISLKIADTFVALGDLQKGEQGFLFCLDSLKKKLSTATTDEDTSILYAQALDRYSLFLLQARRPNEAVKHIESALQVAETVFGDLNNKVGAILLSDMGVVMTAAGESDAAARCFDKALTIAKQAEVDASVAVIMVNRGIALKDNGVFEEAKEWCEMALNEALKEKNKAIKKAAEECLRAKTEDNKKKQSHYAVV